MSEESSTPEKQPTPAAGQVTEPAPGSGDKPPVTTSEPDQQPARPGAAWLPDVVTTLLAIGLALVVGAVLVALSDEDAVASLSYVFSYPADFFSYAGEAIWESYSSLVSGSVGSIDAIGVTLVRAAPLICAGLGVTLAFRAGLFNIGAQGQLVVGALFAGYVGFTWNLPPGLHLVAAVLAGMIGGAIWGGIAGFLKARTGAHEVITTIMLNYLATSFLLNYLLSKEAFQRPGSDNAQSPAPADSAMYLQLGNIHLGVFVAVAAAIVVWWLIERSTFGFELRAVGANPDAARTAGMSVERVYTLAMVGAGTLAGLAATMNILGKGDSLSSGVAGTIGFDAITVALLGRASPLGTVLAGLLFGALSVGGTAMQASAGTPKELGDVLQALIVLFVAAPALVRGIVRMKTAGSGNTVMAKGWGS
ncbi:ABC transporter permease [Nocardioides euryhalodurans]|uniref:ABC transporter permease n=1 Tax=Nocardioides euryhalodurans TaxID=2518370 RepID=A0A4P7GJY5_9ACTN|nr:ABC transporter permease [Nocardioides euryhalodurans]QBR92074.1 ABC transporter permease [Nocardioides euryhalodurans]